MDQIGWEQQITLPYKIWTTLLEIRVVGKNNNHDQISWGEQY